MKKTIVALIVLFALVGCKSSDKDETVTVCKNDSPYAMYESGEQTFVSKGDRVNVIKVKAVLDLEDKEALDEVEANFDALVADMVASDGVKFSMERIDDTRMYDMSEIQLSVADIEELTELGLLQTEETGKIQIVSLKKSIAQIENMGFTCETSK